MMKKLAFVSFGAMMAAVFGGFAIVMVGLAMIGGWRFYSPIPWNDMWGEYLGFYLQVMDGHMAEWWIQHAEHRLLLPRILFWMDIQWFGGQSWFLIVTHYVWVSLAAVLFWIMLRESTKTEQRLNSSQLILGFILTAWLFLWCQSINFIWAWQGMFFLAELLPLCAFYWLHKSIVSPHGARYFLLASGLGFVSIASLANGLLALPLMLVYTLITKQPVYRVVWLVVLWGIAFNLYFSYDFHQSSMADNSVKLILQVPQLFVSYILLYLGSPFYYLLGEGKGALMVAGVSSIFFMSSTVYFALDILPNPRKMSLQLALLLFILYVSFSAVGAAYCRLSWGDPLASRYTTAVLMAWAALLLLYAPAILNVMRKRMIRVCTLLIGLAFLMIMVQMGALLSSNDEYLFNRKAVALALAMQVNATDIFIPRIVCNDPKEVLAVIKRSSERKLSIFSQYPFKDVAGQLGQVYPKSTSPVCQGHIDWVRPVLGDKRFVEVRGWLFEPVNRHYPSSVHIIDSQAKVVGYALTGAPSADIVELLKDKKARGARYEGYLLANGGKPAIYTLQGEQPSCQMQVKIAMPA